MSVLHFELFGHRLASDLDFPELHPAVAGSARWHLRVVQRLPSARSERTIGVEPIYGGVSARLSRHEGGYRIAVDDTGVYDLSQDGREICWQPTVDPWWDFGRGHFIGRVMATSLHLDGVTTLHASAVQMEEGVVAFLAPKRYGKSTLALNLVEHGARFVTDDSLALDVRKRVWARPGVPSVRVEVAPRDQQCVATDTETLAPGRDGKTHLPPMPRELVVDGPTEVSALYLLHPVAPGEPSGPAADRHMIPEVRAAIALMGHMKIGTMLGSEHAPGLLESAAEIASKVPTYVLSVARDLERLPEVVGQLEAWHGAGAAEYARTEEVG